MDRFVAVRPGAPTLAQLVGCPVAKPFGLFGHDAPQHGKARLKAPPFAQTEGKKNVDSHERGRGEGKQIQRQQTCRESDGSRSIHAKHEPTDGINALQVEKWLLGIVHG